MRTNGTTRAILRRRLPRQHRNTIEALPEHLRPGALWRTLKFNHPWPRHNRPFNHRNGIHHTEADPLQSSNLQ